MFRRFCRFLGLFCLPLYAGIDIQIADRGGKGSGVPVPLRRGKPSAVA